MKITSIFNGNSNQFNLRSDESDSVEDTGHHRKSKHSFVESTVSEYVRRSTIHGISYIGDDERHQFERIWWFLMLICSIFGAVYLIYQAYKTMTENPIIESTSLSPVKVWDVPFPAVTFCPLVGSYLTPFALKKSNWPKFAQNFVPDNITELTDQLRSVQLRVGVFVQNLLLQHNYQDNYEILREIFPAIDVVDANWKAGTVDRRVTLHKTISDIGPCRTFNMYNEKYLMREGLILSSPGDVNDKKEPLWSRDYGFKKGLPLESYKYPVRSFHAADGLHLSFKIHLSKFIPFDPKILVFFHPPDELSTSKFTVIEANRHTLVEIAPHLIVSEGIEKFKPSVRRCYYTAERHLKYYRIYTQDNCESECLTNYTLAQCECVSCHMPHFNETKICVENLKCVWEAGRKLYIPEFNGKEKDVHALIDDCDCLPTCTQLTYDAEVKKVEEMSVGENIFIVSFKDSKTIKKYIRSELHSISEFLSITGGSLGLFLGVSIFSIIELIYFCTVRLYLYSKRSDRGKSSDVSNE